MQASIGPQGEQAFILIEKRGLAVYAEEKSKEKDSEEENG
jgi:hypothetical protein